MAMEGGVAQVRVRAPDGTDRQATSGATDSEIRCLHWDGTLLYANGGSLYAIRSPYTGTPTRLGRDWFRIPSNCSYLLLGNSALAPHY